MSHLCLITPWVGGGRLEHTWTKSGAHWSPALQTAWSPGGEGNWLQNGSTGSGRGYEALAIKFKLRIRHTLPRADSRHQLLIFRLEKPFLTDTGGKAGAHRAPAAPAAPWLSPKGQRQQPSKQFPPSLSPLMVEKDRMVCRIAAEGTTRSCAGTLARGARSPDAVLQHALPHCVDQPRLLSTECIGPSVWPRWFRDFKKRI